VCIYSDSGSLEYIRESLERTLVANLEKEDRLLPLIILFQPHPSAGDKELLFLHTEGGACGLGTWTQNIFHRELEHRFNGHSSKQCWGSEYGSAGSACFCGIRIRQSEVRIRILSFSHKGVERTEIMPAK
jgi:hypothetical protein